MLTQKNNLLLNSAVLILAMLVCGIISGWPGKELTWDLAGYHFYNPYAYLHGRFNHMDYWPPSAMQTYLTPTFDFLNYFLITYFSPQMAEFAIGCVHGINFALLFYIARIFTNLFIKQPRYQIYTAIVIAYMGMYAPTVGPFIGSFSNDNTASIFVLMFVLMFLHILKKLSDTNSLIAWQVILASLMLGIAAGGKLTMAPNVIGAFIAVTILPISAKHKLALIFYSGIGFLAGFLLADGYWMWMLWEQFRNPFFPFLNGVFHSPYYQGTNWLEPRYMPKSILEAIFFPFYFSTVKPTAEFYFSDFRFMILYLLLIGLAITRIFKKSPAVFKQNFIVWFYLFFIFSFIIWEMYFSTMRYLGILQMFASLFIFLLVLQITQEFVKRIAALTAIYMFIFISMNYSSPERLPFGTDYFNVKLPNVVHEIKTATVIIPYPFFAMMGYPRPNHYLIPFFPKSWRFTGVPFYKFSYELPKEVSDFVNRGPKTIFLLASADYMPYMYRVADTMHLHASGKCSVITSDRQRFVADTILLCPVTATGDYAPEPAPLRF